MSELKEIGIRWEEDGELHFSHVYLKSEADKVIAHNKYRRCLAMAKVCKLKRFDAADYRIPRRKWDFYDKWFKRWLKVAEQFKDEEAK